MKTMKDMAGGLVSRLAAIQIPTAQVGIWMAGGQAPIAPREALAASSGAGGASAQGRPGLVRRCRPAGGLDAPGVALHHLHADAEEVLAQGLEAPGRQGQAGQAEQVATYLEHRGQHSPLSAANGRGCVEAIFWTTEATQPRAGRRRQAAVAGYVQPLASLQAVSLARASAASLASFRHTSGTATILPILLGIQPLQLPLWARCAKLAACLHASTVVGAAPTSHSLGTMSCRRLSASSGTISSSPTKRFVASAIRPWATAWKHLLCVDLSRRLTDSKPGS